MGAAVEQQEREPLLNPVLVAGAKPAEPAKSCPVKRCPAYKLPSLFLVAMLLAMLGGLCTLVRRELGLGWSCIFFCSVTPCLAGWLALCSALYPMARFGPAPLGTERRCMVEISCGATSSCCLFASFMQCPLCPPLCTACPDQHRRPGHRAHAGVWRCGGLAWPAQPQQRHLPGPARVR